MYLDGWRAVAIAGVFLDHFGYSRVLNTGRLGVELFFVLSGRLMAEILFEDDASLGRFYFRRFTRVWPVLAVFVAAMLVATHLRPDLGVHVGQTIAALTYTANYVYFFGHGANAIDHLWSLCIEEHSYIFLGILALIVRKLPRIFWPMILSTIALCIADGILSTYALHQDYYHVYWRTDVRAASILIGAAIYLAGKRHVGVFATLPSIAFGIVGILLNLNAIPDPLKYSAGTVCFAICVANLANSPEAVRSVLSQRWIVWFGTISYSLYVWQQPFGLALSRVIPVRAEHLALAIIVGIASFYVIERPARLYLNEHAPGWATDPAL